jgi:hypothetical protein
VFSFLKNHRHRESRLATCCQRSLRGARPPSVSPKRRFFADSSSEALLGRAPFGNGTLRVFRPPRVLRRFSSRRSRIVATSPFRALRQSRRRGGCAVSPRELATRFRRRNVGGSIRDVVLIPSQSRIRRRQQLFCVVCLKRRRLRRRRRVPREVGFPPLPGFLFVQNFNRRGERAFLFPRVRRARLGIRGGPHARPQLGGDARRYGAARRR